MSDEKKDIRFKKAFMGGFKRQSVAVYIEELQKELFESRAAAAKAVKDFEEYRVKESVVQQKAALDSEENQMLRMELEETKAKLAAMENSDKPAAVDTSGFEAELLRERGVSESLRLNVAELKKQLSEEYSANELLAAALNEKNGEIAALIEKISAVEPVVSDDSVAEALRAEAAAELERVKNESAAEIERIKNEAAAEIDRIKADMSGELENARSEAAAEVEKMKAEAAAELENVRIEATAQIEEAKAEAAALRAELYDAERLLIEAREAAEAYSAKISEQEIDEATYMEVVEDGFEQVEAVTSEETEYFEAAPADTMPQEAPIEEKNEPEAQIIPQEVIPVTLREKEEQESQAETAEEEKADEITDTSEEIKQAPSSAPTVYDKDKIADIIARYTNIRNQSDNNQQ